MAAKGFAKFIIVLTTVSAVVMELVNTSFVNIALIFFIAVILPMVFLKIKKEALENKAAISAAMAETH